MTNLSKLVVLSLFSVLGTANAASHQTLRCAPATKALPAIRSVVIHQTAGDLFNGVGSGVAAVQVIVNGTLRQHRIPVSSYWSKGFAFNVFATRGSSAQFYLHANTQSFTGTGEENITGDVGYGSLRVPVNCRYLN